MQAVWVMLAGIVLFGISCDRGSERRAEKTQEQNMVQRTAAIAKVKLDRAGVIYLNGKIATVEELKQEFARLKEAKGTVWYFRENPQGDPGPQAMAVIQAIVDARLPVRLLEREFD